MVGRKSAALLAVIEKSNVNVEFAASGGPDGVGPEKQKKAPFVSQPFELRPPLTSENPPGGVAVMKLGGVVKENDCTPKRPQQLLKRQSCF